MYWNFMSEILHVTKFRKWFQNLIPSLLNMIVYWPSSSPKAHETRFQSKVEAYQRLKKMVLDASLLNTQHYKVWIKGKVE